MKRLILALSFLAAWQLACGDSGGSGGAGSGGGGSGGDAAGGSGGTAAGGSGGTSAGGSGGSGTAGVTYTTDVQPILQGKCAPCHVTGASGGVNHASSWDDTQRDSLVCTGEKVYQCMLERVQNGEMPKGMGCTGDPAKDAGNAACLTAAEQSTLQAWVQAGGPR